MTAYGPTLPICKFCGEELVVPTNWCKHRAKQKSLTCRKCESIRARGYNTKRRERRRKWLDKIKLSKGCELCGYKVHPAALHFDHIDPDKKLFGIGSNIGTNLKRLFQEIRKCRVLCANCHSVHTSKEKHNARNRKYE